MIWSLTGDSLSSTERRLVGIWRSQPDPKTGTVRVTFSPDRKCRAKSFDSVSGKMMWRSEYTYPWFERDGVILLDGEPNPIRRAVRPVMRLLGLTHTDPMILGPALITADEIVFTLPDGARQVWTRDRGD
jgi:hypothetical protein